jgi:uncharacterized membrane protein
VIYAHDVTTEQPMYEISHQVRINAPVDQVWNVLTDFEWFPEWSQ